MEPIKINLATFKYQDKRLSYSVILATALIVLIVSLLSIKNGINTQGEIRELENRLAIHEKNIITRQQIKKETTIRLEDGEIESLKKDIDFINGLIKSDAYPYDRLLDSLELCAPRGIVLSVFKMSKDLDTVILNGKANSMDEITVFLNSLKNSKIYKNISLLKLAVSQEDNLEQESAAMDDGITFEIECSIDKDEIWIKS